MVVAPCGLRYALALSDLILAPATPSNTARVGGVIMPITTSLAKAFGSEPQDGPRKNWFFLDAINLPSKYDYICDVPNIHGW